MAAGGPDNLEFYSLVQKNVLTSAVSLASITPSGVNVPKESKIKEE